MAGPAFSPLAGSTPPAERERPEQATKQKKRHKRDVHGWIVLAALDRNKKFLRGEIAHRVNLKFAPDIRFRVDERFDEAERIEKLLRTPAVQKDLEQDLEQDPDSDREEEQ